MIVECPECRTKNQLTESLQYDRKYQCGKCGAVIYFLQTENAEARENDTLGIADRFETDTPGRENTSGLGKLATVPPEIKERNWGAFLLAPIWSAYNYVWIGLLSLIPFVGVIVMFTIGQNGNEWAWRSKRWDSIEHFKMTQKKWQDWGLGLLLVTLIIWFLAYLSATCTH
jgi:hypothetical protein